MTVGQLSSVAVAVRGQGALGVWHDVVPAHERAVEDWYDREHHAERVAIPGFLRARRYRSTGVGRRYFSRYDTETSAVLASPPYLHALNHPSDWSKSIFQHYRRTVRGAFQLVARAGEAEGGSLLSLRFHGDGVMIDTALDDLPQRLVTQHGVVGAEAWRIDMAATSPPTTERDLRAGQDVHPRAALLIDASRIAHAVAALEAIDSAELLAKAQVESYTLEFQKFASWR